LARTYGGDLASTDGCHLGRLAGFTNQKLQRRTARGYAPWVTIVEAHAGIARAAQELLHSATQLIAQQSAAVRDTPYCLYPGCLPGVETQQLKGSINTSCVRVAMHTSIGNSRSQNEQETQCISPTRG